MVFSLLAQHFKAAVNPRVYGYIILAFTVVGYLGSNWFYYKGGREYEKVMLAK